MGIIEIFIQILQIYTRIDMTDSKYVTASKKFVSKYNVPVTLNNKAPKPIRISQILYREN